MRYVVDTHALLWYLANHSRLGARARTVFVDPQSDLVLPATALAEACWIVASGRVALAVSDVLDAVDADPRLSVYALDRAVVYALDQAVIERTTAPDMAMIDEMHDRQIVATALLVAGRGEPVALLTHDGSITSAGLVPVVW